MPLVAAIALIVTAVLFVVGIITLIVGFATHRVSMESPLADDDDNDELLVDTPYSHLQPVGAVDGLRGDVIALVLVCDVPLRSIGGQVELALATGLARLVNGIHHMLLGYGVI